MHRTIRRTWASGALLAAITMLAACGTTDPATTETTSTPAAEQSAGPVTFTDGRGEQVTLPDGPATKVVVLEWSQAESVIALGVDPIGLADVTGYTSWVGNVAPFTTEPTDVGVRREPSVETIATLEPDLILGSVGSIPDSAMEQMERIAPIALMNGADGNDPLGLIRSEFTTIATALGKETQAEEVLATYDTTITENAQKLADAGLEGTPVVLTSPYADGANVTIRMHGPRTAVQAVAEDMGLTAAWEDAGDEQFGLSNIDLEGLTELPDDTRFLYWGNDDSEDIKSLEESSLWTELPFVKDDHVYRGAVGIWAYGGPASMTAWSNDLTEQLTSN